MPPTWSLAPGFWEFLTGVAFVVGAGALITLPRGRRWLALTLAHSLARRWLWSASLAVLLFLGSVQMASDAQYYLASLAILPIMAISWVFGRRHGLALSLIAAVLWIVADYSAPDTGSPWLSWANALTRLATYVVVAELVAEVRSLLARERDEAMHDALTGLLNRRAFFELGDIESMRSLRYGHPLAIVFIDLDNFKQLNDTRGHKAGDAALRLVAHTLHTKLRLSDSVARLGGDEFAIVLPEIEYAAAVDTGHKIAATLRQALAGPPPVTASVGVAWFQRACASFDPMLAAADGLMYEAKQAGKNGFVARRLAPTVAEEKSA